MKRHTAGPWSVLSTAGQSGHKVVDAKGRTLCVFPPPSSPGIAETNANAAVIAAAPLLVAALADAMPLLRAAVAKKPNGAAVVESARIALAACIPVEELPL